MINVESMRTHIDALICQRDIIVKWLKRPGGMAYALAELGEIWITPIKSVVSYSTALHEIGHVLGRFQTSNRCLVRERWAWTWAEENALIWTPPMQRNRERCMGWYAANARKVDKQYADVLRRHGSVAEQFQAAAIELSRLEGR